MEKVGYERRAQECTMRSLHVRHALFCHEPQDPGECGNAYVWLALDNETSQGLPLTP